MAKKVKANGDPRKKLASMEAESEPHTTSPINGAPSIDSVVTIIRAVWNAIENADEAGQAKLKKDFAQTVNRLKSRVERQLGKPIVVPKEGWLLGQEERTQETVAIDAVATRFPEPPLRVYAKDLAEHALKFLPKLAGCKSSNDIRKYLTNTLPFNSQSTRRRNANYLVSRYFPDDVVHPDVVAFASVVEGKPALGDALFYLTCRTEKIVALVAEEIVFPSLVMGGVSRAKIKDYVQSQFPNSKSAVSVGAAVVGTYERFGVATATRTRLNVSLREGSLAAFAYVLHLEFPEPGMYSFERMIDGPMQKWLLWDQQWMVRQLYVLREVGLLSKVSEIDQMRQFTTKYPLVEAIKPIVALVKESPT